jgi:serine/threonine-protein kinase
MLTGRVPFPGEGFGEVLVRHVREPPPLPSRLNPAVPPALEKIVLHALAKKPDFRFASMDEFRSALRDPERFSQTLDGHSATLTPDGGMAAVGVAGMGPPPPAPASPSGRFPPSQSPRALSNDAPTMLAQQAPDAAAIERAKADAQRQRHEATTAPTPQKRPDPQRMVQARPQKATVAEPLRPARNSRAPVIALLVVGALALGAGGWYFLAGPGHGGNVAVTVTTEPTGAEVYDGDQLVGTSPVVVKVARNSEPHTIMVKKEGYLSAQRVVGSKEDRALALRLSAKPAEEKEEAPPPPEPAKAPVAATPPPRKPVAVAAPPPTPKPESPKAEAPKKHHARPKKEDTLILTPSF